MKHRIAFALPLVLILSPALSPALADTTDEKSLMERGAEMFFEGLRQEMEPKLDDLRGMAEKVGPSMTSFLQEMGPAFMDMVNEVKDWSRYEAPEMLPNGDIIIRRKPDPEADDQPAPQGDLPENPSATDL